MIKTKGNEAWTTTPETHRLTFKVTAQDEQPAYFTRIFLAKGLTADDLVEVAIEDIPQEEEQIEPEAV